jgi:hypothetical protein
MKRRVLLLALGCAAIASEAADLQAEVLKRLDASPVLQGEFEQSKSLKGFKNPLVSKGEFLLARSQGIVWETKQPFASTLVITSACWRAAPTAAWPRRWTPAASPRCAWSTS